MSDPEPSERELLNRVARALVELGLVRYIGFGQFTLTVTNGVIQQAKIEKTYKPEVN